MPVSKKYPLTFWIDHSILLEMEILYLVLMQGMGLLYNKSILANCI